MAQNVNSLSFSYGGKDDFVFQISYLKAITLKYLFHVRQSVMNRLSIRLIMISCLFIICRRNANQFLQSLNVIHEVFSERE